jgi:hypothetical protein
MNTATLGDLLQAYMGDRIREQISEEYNWWDRARAAGNRSGCSSSLIEIPSDILFPGTKPEPEEIDWITVGGI